VFADERAPRVFPEWDRIADERALPLSFGAPSERSVQLVADLTAIAGSEFTGRLHRAGVPGNAPQLWSHPVAGRLCFDREILELPAADAQQLIVLLPADEATQTAVGRLHRGGGLALVR
jgi:hypothetical protein